MRRRIKEGRIRDCHGDLHMANICLTNGIDVFDCIEFNPRFRYGDMAADVAFLAMDLDFHGLADFSRHFAARFAEAALDEDLDAVLNFYEVLPGLRPGQDQRARGCRARGPASGQARAREAARAYYALAGAYAREGAQWTASWW